jgi:hypothetical protein
MNTEEAWAWVTRQEQDAAGYEQRQRCVALIECSHCKRTVELVAETIRWAPRAEGRWRHVAYGPPMGVCCDRLYLDDPVVGVRTFRRQKEEA